MIPSNQPHLETAALTHPGMTGKDNEDRYILVSFKPDAGNGSQPVVLAVVADGVGGKQAGEIAAQTAVDTIARIAAESPGADPLATLRRAYHESNQAIIEQAGEGMETSGMATTATCAWVAGDKLYAANIGNSRLYLLREDALRRISIDHSWVEEALHHGLITPEQATNHPQAHVITRHLGSKDPEPDLRLRLSPEEDDEKMAANQGLRLAAGDVLLVCSDGLPEVVLDEEIAAELKANDLESALIRLTDLANERGGPDNITSIALRVPEKALPAVPPVPAPPEPRRRGRFGLYLVSTFLLVILILFGWLFYLSFIR
ncbi:MAG TPA: protein phosphatase 2C domain-containing protein [Anaerolineales bacterium]|nr:protein phosphatase 2C domain-containing protein [Anaerolineales bacterium]